MIPQRLLNDALRLLPGFRLYGDTLNLRGPLNKSEPHEHYYNEIVAGLNKLDVNTASARTCQEPNYFVAKMRNRDCAVLVRFAPGFECIAASAPVEYENPGGNWVKHGLYALFQHEIGVWRALLQAPIMDGISVGDFLRAQHLLLDFGEGQRLEIRQNLLHPRVEIELVMWTVLNRSHRSARRPAKTHSGDRLIEDIISPALHQAGVELPLLRLETSPSEGSTRERLAALAVFERVVGNI